MRAWLWCCFFALAACGARSGIDGDQPAKDASFETDAAANAAIGAADADAMSDAAVPMDAATCVALPAASCTCPPPCSPPFDTVLQDAIAECSKQTFACGYVEVVFDPNGCAETFGYTTNITPKEFRDCFEGVVSSQRWPCEVGATLTAYLGSCTVH